MSAARKVTIVADQHCFGYQRVGPQRRFDRLRRDFLAA
jgi:hypothetical protein